MNMTKKVMDRLMYENNKDVGNFVRERRKVLGLNQLALAKRLKTSQAEVSNIERGSKKHIKVSDYAAALEVHPKAIFSAK
jgi:transcriptional regulator with XRE-family HTH domain